MSEIKKISIATDGSTDFETLHTEVIVQFGNGNEYIATFLSAKKLEQIIDGERKSEGYSLGKYYKMLNAVMISDLNYGDLLPIVEHMISEGDFQLMFRKI